jgi:hypothetical protein
MSADSTFLAFERHLKRATGESVVTIEAAYDPWETEIDLMDQRLGFTKPPGDLNGVGNRARIEKCRQGKSVAGLFPPE